MRFPGRRLSGLPGPQGPHWLTRSLRAPRWALPLPCSLQASESLGQATGLLWEVLVAGVLRPLLLSVTIAVCRDGH